MVVAGQVENRQAKLAFVALPDGSTEQVRDQVVPIADTEDGNAGPQDFAFEGGAGIVVNAVGASGNDEAPGVGQILQWCFAGEYFGRDSEFPYLTSYKVAVLTAGIEYGYLSQLLLPTFSSAQR
jgi:hypothetical protein